MHVIQKSEHDIVHNTGKIKAGPTNQNRVS